jgi:alpha-beta hydrolase superfamily lysophospholipase
MLISIFLVLLALYRVIVLGIAWFSLHPIRTPVFVSPGLMGAPQEDVILQMPRHRLRGWWVRAENPKGVVVFVHGYLMNRAELAPVAYQLWKQGYASLLIDLRAHGGSGGKKCTLGYFEREDVAEALRYARGRAEGLPLIVVGSSMGAAASALALADDPSLADVLVMDSGYSMLSSAVLGWWRFLGGQKLMVMLAPTLYVAAPMAGFSPFSVDIAAALAKIGPKPVLHLHGERDTLALPAEAQRNYDACAGPKRLVWFAGLGHSEYRWEQPVKYMEALEDFLAEHAILANDPGART